MCGIAGYIGKKEIDSTIIAKTLKLMKNRGPDYNSWTKYNAKNSDTNVLLLHSRLSIIDLDPRSHQPFEVGEYNLVFNGEIYNYLEVKSKLKKEGHEFQTDSDTEVLLKSYIQYGENCVEHLEGMWAFAIWNNITGELFLSRDRFSEKPLYISEEKDGFFFASETKFIRSLSNKKFEVNDKQIMKNLFLGYKSLHKNTDTFFKDIYEIKGSTNLIITEDLRVKKNTFWSPRLNINTDMSLSEAIDGAKHYLLNSLKIRLRSDVPLAFCLSGGVDSSGLVSIASKVFNQKVKSFSIIDDDERYNEYDNISATVNDTESDSTYIKLNFSNSGSRLENLVKYHDAPVATITNLIHSMLCENISDKGYKVSFSGASADEIFTGYYDHFLLHLATMYGSDEYDQYLKNWQDYLRPHIRNPILQNPNLYNDNSEYRVHVFDNSEEFVTFSKNDINDKFEETLYFNDLLRNRMVNELFHEITPVVLHQDDLNSMMYSIENRSPYLDKDLLEFMLTVPNKYLIRNGKGKFILREALAGILNDKVRNDRVKKGFNASINSLFDFDDKNFISDLLNPNSRIADYVNLKIVEKIIKMDPAPNHYSKFLFSFISTKMFLEMEA